MSILALYILLYPLASCYTIVYFFRLISISSILACPPTNPMLPFPFLTQPIISPFYCLVIYLPVLSYPVLCPSCPSIPLHSYCPALCCPIQVYPVLLYPTLSFSFLSILSHIIYQSYPIYILSYAMRYITL